MTTRRSRAIVLGCCVAMLLTASNAFACEEPTISLQTGAAAASGDTVAFSIARMDPGARYTVTVGGTDVASGVATARSQSGTFRMPDLGREPRTVFVAATVDHDGGQWYDTKQLAYTISPQPAPAPAPAAPSPPPVQAPAQSAPATSTTSTTSPPPAPASPPPAARPAQPAPAVAAAPAPATPATAPKHPPHPRAGAPAADRGRAASPPVATPAGRVHIGRASRSATTGTVARASRASLRAGSRSAARHTVRAGAPARGREGARRTGVAPRHRIAAHHVRRRRPSAGGRARPPRTTPVPSAVAVAAHRDRPWELFGLAAVLAAGAACGGALLFRRRRRVPPPDVLEAELQEIISEERARRADALVER